MLNIVVFFIVLATIVICWNCKIHPSLLVLLVVLGLGLCTCYVREAFQEEPSVPIAINNETLAAAGIVRPNVFNCANQIGVTAEINPLFATKNDL